MSHGHTQKVRNVLTSQHTVYAALCKEAACIAYRWNHSCVTSFAHIQKGHAHLSCCVISLIDTIT